MLRYMLDTNIVIYTIKNRPEAVRIRFNENQGAMAISTVTLGELVYGAERSSDPTRNLRDVEGFAARVEVCSFDENAAFHFGQVRSELYARGEPIGPYDMMIAAHARSLGLILITNNRNEFDRVDGLRVENWVKRP